MQPRHVQNRLVVAVDATVLCKSLLQVDCLIRTERWKDELSPGLSVLDELTLGFYGEWTKQQGIECSYFGNIL